MNGSQVTLYIATSVDGYIADETGGVGWLEEFEQDPETSDIAADYEEFFASIDCLVMGATTYEQILTFGEWPYADKPTYVFTHRELSRATDTVEFVDGEISSLAAELTAAFDHIWVVGGAQVARAFMDAGQIDDLRLSFIPVLLGSGIPLFAADGEKQGLQLRNTTTYDSGIVELHYNVVS